MVCGDFFKFVCKIVSGVIIFCGLAFIIAGAVIGWVVYPDLIKDVSYLISNFQWINSGESPIFLQQVELKEGTEQYKRFENLPIPFNFNVYAFDIQNYEAVVAGTEKPKVVEKGPYVYM